MRGKLLFFITLKEKLFRNVFYKELKMITYVHLYLINENEK